MGRLSRPRSDAGRVCQPGPVEAGNRSARGAAESSRPTPRGVLGGQGRDVCRLVGCPGVRGGGMTSNPLVEGRRGDAPTVDARPLAVFDLDGTLLTADTFLPFLVGYGLRHRKR